MQNNTCRFTLFSDTLHDDKIFNLQDFHEKIIVIIPFGLWHFIWYG